MPISALDRKTNSLINVGDFITIRIESPLYPNFVKLLGFYITTNDVIDEKEQIAIYYYLFPESQLAEITESDVIENWTLVDKSDQSSYNIFINNCNSYSEPYFIWFKIEKITSIGKFLTIDKVSLQLENILQDEIEYPFYNKSIFREDFMYDENTMKWSNNVLEKIIQPGILPTYLKRKGVDFITFWGSITHFFAIIVKYARRFRDFLQDESLFGLYLKQKDYYRNHNFGLFSDIILNSNQKLTYTIQQNKRINEAGYPSECDGYACSNLISIKENNYIYLALDNFDQTIYYESSQKTYKGSVGRNEIEIYSFILEIIETCYFRIYVEETSSLRIGSKTYTLNRGYTLIKQDCAIGENKVLLSCYYGTNFEFTKLANEFEYNTFVEIEEKVQDIFGDQEYEVDVAFYDERKEFIVQNIIYLSKNKLSSWFYIEKRQDVSYVMFSYNLPSQLLIKLTAYGEGDVNIKDYTVEELLNVYPIFKNRGTIHSNNAIKKICETKNSDTFFSDYLPIEDNCSLLDKGNGFSEILKKSIVLSEFIPSRITPMINGELVEFVPTFVHFTNNNGIKIHLEHNSLNEFKDGTHFFRILLHINLFAEDYNNYEGILDKNGYVKYIEINNVPSNIGDLELPILCIKDKTFNTVRNNLIKLDYFNDIYLFAKKNIENDKELVYLQIQSLCVIPEEVSFDANYLIGYRIVENKNLVSLSLVGLNTVSRLLTLKYTYQVVNETDDNQDTRLISKNINWKYNPNDIFGPYIKIIVSDEHFKGLFLLNNVSFLKDIPLEVSTSILRVFTLKDNDINSYEAIAEFMDNNVVSDWGDAFSYYYKPYVDFGNASTTDIDIEEITTKDLNGGAYVYSGLDKYIISSFNCYYTLRKLSYGLNYIDIRNYHFTNYKNNGLYSNEDLEEIISQKFIPYQGFRIFENVNKNSLLYVVPLKFTNIDLSYVSHTSTYFSMYLKVNWVGGYSPYNLYLYEDGVLKEQHLGLERIDWNFNLSFSKSVNYVRILKVKVVDNLEIEVENDNIKISPINDLSISYKLNVLSGNENQVSSKNINGLYDDLFVSPSGGVPPYKISYKDRNQSKRNVYTTLKHYIQLENFPFLRSLSTPAISFDAAQVQFDYGNLDYNNYNYFAIRMEKADNPEISEENTYYLKRTYEGLEVPLIIQAEIPFNRTLFITDFINSDIIVQSYFVTTFASSEPIDIKFKMRRLSYLEYLSLTGGISNQFTVQDSLGYSKDFYISHNVFYSMYDDESGSCKLN